MGSPMISSFTGSQRTGRATFARYCIKMPDRRAAMTDLDVADRTLAGSDAIEEVGVMIVARVEVHFFGAQWACGKGRADRSQ